MSEGCKFNPFKPTDSTNPTNLIRENTDLLFNGLSMNYNLL
jgi:hypothetical protein